MRVSVEEPKLAELIQVSFRQIARQNFARKSFGLQFLHVGNLHPGQILHHQKLVSAQLRIHLLVWMMGKITAWCKKNTIK